MSKYAKMDSVFKRYNKEDQKAGLIPEGLHVGSFIDGEYSDPDFKALENIEWEWTEKVDGANIRLIINVMDGDIQIRGRDENSSVSAELLRWFELWEEQCGNDAYNMFADADTDEIDEIVLYGEGVGPKTQKGKHGFDAAEIVLFDIKVGKWWLKKQHVEAIASEIGLESVKVIRRATLVEMIEHFRNIDTEPATEFGNKKPIMEGLVGTPTTGVLSRSGERIITKLKHKDFRKKTHKQK